MRFHFLILIVMIMAVPGCSTLSKKEERYFHDRDVVNETVRSCFNRPYEGLVRHVPSKDISYDPYPDFPGKDHIRSYMHSRTGWCDMRGYQVVYRPAAGEPAPPPVDAEKVLEYYFGRLEMAGFVRGARKSTTTDSMQTADKSWVNKDRTIFVSGQVVSDIRTGQTIITSFISGTIK
jgi:hypothetical protein